MSFAIFEENYYYGSEASSIFEPVPLIAILISALSVYFSFKAIKISKKTEIVHKKFQDLCLDPVKMELDRMRENLISIKSTPISNQINSINTKSRDFSMLLIRIRSIYPNIDVSEMQNEYQDFADLCLNQPSGALTESIIDEFQILRVSILNKVYDQAMHNLGTGQKS
jgi:hypothetical protein